MRSGFDIKHSPKTAVVATSPPAPAYKITKGTDMQKLMRAWSKAHPNVWIKRPRSQRAA